MGCVSSSSSKSSSSRTRHLHEEAVAQSSFAEDVSELEEALLRMEEGEQTSWDVDDVIRVVIVEGRIALVALRGSDVEENDVFPWGTRKLEHRINPTLVTAMNRALDLALASKEVSAVVVSGEGRFFCNGMDLKYIDENPHEADALQQSAEALMARILTFPLPTIAAINGHFVAAGAMLGLAFDYRVMNGEKGTFFIPGVDLGLVYSPGMTELMKAKTPVHMHNDMILFAKRYNSAELLQECVIIKQIFPGKKVVAESLLFAESLIANNRFGTPKYRDTLQKIKRETYKRAYDALTSSFRGMGFEKGEWDEQGKAKL